MNPLLFARLGYKIEKKLSEIESIEYPFSSLSQPDFSRVTANVVDAIKERKSYYERQLNDPSELQPYIKKGFDYKTANENPTLREIVLDLNSSVFNNNYLQHLLEKADVPNPASEQLAKITKVFQAIAKGYMFGRFIPELESLFEIAYLNRHYFSNLVFTTYSDVKKELMLADLLNKCGFNLEETIKEYEAKQKRVEGLKKEFQQIQTPDREKTIKDRIESINNKIKPSENAAFFDESLHRIGYLLAIRGENPKLFQLLKNNSKYIKNDPWYLVRGDFGSDEMSNCKRILLYLLEGYSYSYHLAFLEQELTKSDSLTEEAGEIFVKLKWAGQKNQLYYVIRELKNKGLIGNSYEDLAVILKQYVDVFQHTSLSTIQKEMGKDKKPPKSKRIDLHL